MFFIFMKDTVSDYKKLLLMVLIYALATAVFIFRVFFSSIFTHTVPQRLKGENK